ncbi:MAG: hypothetical protein ACP5TE_07690 [Verrucomicrobiia bacterium]
MRKSILVVLNNVYPLLLPEQSLYIDVNCLLEKPATMTQIREELSKLEACRFVAGLRASDGVLKWRLTDNGRAELVAS